MPRYRYKAYDASGALIEGEVEAASNEAAVAALFERKLFPFDAAEAEAQAPRAWWNAEVSFGRSLPVHELAILTREIATFLAAGIPVDQALRDLAGEAQSRRVRQLLAELEAGVREGQSLSSALERHGSVFQPFYVSLVRAGEAGGALDKSFQELARLLERSAEVRSRVRSAMVYPIVLLCVALAAMVLIMTVLVPAMLPLFEGVGREPPLMFWLLAQIHGAISGYPLPALLATIMSILVLILLFRSEALRAALDWRLHKLPVIGALAAKSEAGRLCRTLAALLRGGLTIVPALAIVRDVLRNRRFASGIGQVIDDIKEGGSLRKSLADVDLLPRSTLRLIATGEETGRLNEMLSHAAEILEGQVQRQLDRLMSILTPVLTLAIGVAVGGLMLSVMNAVLSVNELALQ